MRVTRNLFIDEAAITERFIHAAGPGGQNVNKVATAVELRLDTVRCRSFTPEMLARLRRIAGRRLSAEGVLVIQAQRFRSQARNREDARERLLELLLKAATPPAVRRKTAPSRAAKQRRLDEKHRQSERKRSRSPGDWPD